jgi:lipoprotein-anchoring transpeptidase ErfK/SrfK
MVFRTAGAIATVLIGVTGQALAQYYPPPQAYPRPPVPPTVNTDELPPLNAPVVQGWMLEWPDWTLPEKMIVRQPYLPRFMAGGETNPLGARAVYLGNTVYRIHGTNQPSTIGTFVSSRMHPADQ